MVNVQPLEDYLRAIELFKDGRKDEAAQHIASSVGTGSPTPYMRDTLNELTKPNLAILALILNESRRG